MKKLGPRAYRLHKIMDFVGVIFLGFFLLFLWQLYRGPVEVPFLKPYIIKALNHDDSQYQVTLDNVNIELVRSIKPLKIIANNVDYRKTDGSFIITAPRTSLSFSIRALLRGIIAPSSIEVSKPTVYIFTNYGIKEENKNEVNQKKIEYYFDGFEEFIERFNSEDKVYPESYINDIAIENASVEFHEVDLGRKWVFSDLNYHFERNFSNIESSFNALIKSNEHEASIGLDAEYRPFGNKVGLQFYFNELFPTDIIESLLGEEEAKKFLKINIPVSGRIDTLIDFAAVLKNKDNIVQSLDSAIESLQFNFEGGSGTIHFSDKAEEDYKISGFLLEGDLSAGLDKLQIENASLDLGKQNALLSVYVNGVKDYLLKRSMDNLQLKLKTKVNSVKFDELYDYWPRYAGTLAWDWCKSSLFGGEIKNAEFEFDFGYNKKNKQFTFENLSGIGTIADTTLDYLTGMPRVAGIYGTAHFSNDTIKIDIDKAISNNVLVNSGFVRLYDLNKYDNFAEISLQAESDISAALDLIDHNPLNYATEMGIKPDSFKGTAETDLYLDFELKRDLAPDEVKVKVSSVLNNVEIPDILDKQAITAQKLDLHVDNNGLTVSGQAKLDNIPLELSWNENFANKLYKSRYNLSFIFDDNVKKKAGITTEFINPPYIEGTTKVLATITKFDDTHIQADLTADMTEAQVDYSFFGLYKPIQEVGDATIRLDFKNGKLREIPNFGFNKKDFLLQGKMDIDKDGQIKVIDITQIKAPKTNAKAKIEFTNEAKQKVKINVSGSSYDLSAFFKEKAEVVTADGKKNTGVKEEEDALEQVTDTDIFIAVNNIWTNEYASVKNFAGSAKLRHGIGIEDMHLIGNFDGSQKQFIKLDYTPRPNNEYLLSVESNDAGGTLKFLRVYDNMRGGRLSINGKRGRNKQFIGHAQIRDFSIHNTPLLAKLLTVASLSGIVNMLTGEGIAFSHLDIPFTYRNQVLSFNEGKAFGNVMGITVNGEFDRNTEELNIKGVIVPAYGLNNFIGKLPILGNLLSGKDGTVFAANYNIGGNLDNPDISINPLSALSPSSLKDLLGSMFGDSKGD